MIKLENKLYTSTEVAEILGVSLRSVYRYLEEGKLDAEVKTATGRHRFTRQNIIDFLYPKGLPAGVEIELPEDEAPQPEKKPVLQKKVAIKEVEPEEEPEEEVQEDVVVAKEDEPVEEESVDWLSKFREAAKKFEDETVEEEPAGVTGLADDGPQSFYYRSRLGGLKDIAQNIDKTSKNSGLDYAFTMHSGLSLYKPINPFSTLHVYCKSKDKDFFERILTLTPSDENNAQLCLLISDDDKLFKSTDEMHGLRVVSKDRLLEDIAGYDEELLSEAQNILK